MPTNLDSFKGDLSKLISLGREMNFDLAGRTFELELLSEEIREAIKERKDCFEKNYQRWYTEALAILKQLLPDRLLEFTQLYQWDSRRKQIDSTTYRIQDWLNGITERAAFGPGNFDTQAVIYNLFKTQLEILESVQARFESSLFDIAQLVRVDLFDSELDAALELTKHGFLRGAGAIAGVVIEKHLAQVCANHNVLIRKQDPAISHFNDALKSAGVLDVPNWRQIQRLGDIRNLCDHNKEREPTREEVVELIDGVQKICKTLF